MDSWDMLSLGSSPDVPDDPGFETFFWHLYRKNKFTDVMFELEAPSEPVSFSAHRLVLSLWSPVFADMFYGAKNPNNLVHLNDVNPEAFEDMLKFMYGCEPQLESYDTACKLNRVAVQFGVTSLVNFCQNFLSHIDIEDSNVFDILEFADSVQNKSLIDRCMGLIRRETRNIFMLYDISSISPAMIRIILNCPKLALSSEFELQVWLFKWAETKYTENPTYRSTREVLEEFLPRMNFLALTNVQFATLYKRHDRFFSQDEALRIFMNIGIRDSSPMPGWYDKGAEFREYTD